MPIENGDTVKVHYTGTLTDGQQFDSSRTPGREPLEFTVGKGEMIPGFEQAVKGHEVGDRFSVTIPCEQAYGTVDEKTAMAAELISGSVKRVAEYSMDIAEIAINSAMD